MIVFQLTMPGRNTWNGKWSGDGYIYARMRYDKDVPKDRWGKDFYYDWDDGWCACVSVTHMSARDAHKFCRNSRGFAGYDWMISSIINKGYIARRDK